MFKKLLLILISFALSSTPVFSQSYSAGSCSPIPGSKTCIDSTPCKTAETGETVCLAGNFQSGALTIQQSCWQYGYKFACENGGVNTCTTLEANKACSLVKTSCSSTNPTNGDCVQHDYTYQCQTQAAKTQDQLVCSSGLFQTASFPTPQNPNNTFAKAAVASELIRETAAYSKNGTGIFGGVAETCTQGYGGIKNCCNSTPGAKSNAAVMNLALSAGASVVKYAGAVAVDAASPYAYDMMYEAGKWTDNFDLMLEGSTGTTDFAASGPSFGAYGFTYQSGVAAEGSGLMGANSTIATFGEGSSMSSVTFNPYVFGAMVAIAVIQSLRACTADEQMLAMHRGANLSYFIKQECTNNVPLLGCMEYTSTYCSFNSVLAKVVNQQGKPQLGKPLEDCGGFLAEDLPKLDFSKIDFTEFTGQIAAQAQKNIPTNMSGNYTPIMQNTTQGSAQSKNPALPKY